MGMRASRNGTRNEGERKVREIEIIEKKGRKIGEKMETRIRDSEKARQEHKAYETEEEKREE